jgi:4-amino-4-deoxy-L-arabinose transferase-like glycosyltransferase
MLKRLSIFLQQLTTTQLAWIALILCIPAFLLNLGQVAFIGDEGIRSLVALEMKLSDNYIVPTLNGEFYFNKPPLYNWMILGMSNLFGYFGEWPTRLTTILS